MVMTQAIATSPAMPQRTADARRAAPAPITQPVTVCVVDTGIPRKEAAKSMTEAPADALNPWCCDNFVILVPIVSITRHPPVSVPRPIAT